MGKIDFSALAAALLDRAEELVKEWLPGGRRVGREWRCGSLSGDKGDSFAVNLVNGRWSDFQTGESGGDFISLYAAIFNMKQGDAAKELAARIGGVTVPTRQARAAPVKAEKPAHQSDWQSVVPVPDVAGPPPGTHPYQGEPSRTWHYTRDGLSYGYVYRFDKEDGRKEVLPLTWCRNVGDGTGAMRWHWKTWDAPRPLYLPAGTIAPELAIGIVEGEKCADVLHGLLGAELVAATWPGGGKAAHHADWSWLSGKRCVLWPDCDAKRRRLTAEEKAAGVDPETVDLLPAEKQPGVSAMLKIADLLQAIGADVWIIPVPAPGDAPDGWDVADAAAEGWDADRVRTFMRTARRYVPQKPRDQRSADASTDQGLADQAGDDPRAWRSRLILSEKGAIKPVRENAVLALQSLPETAGQIAYNSFTNDIEKLTDMPWGSAAGNWGEVDELLMGEWLVRQHWLPSMPRTTLEESLRMVAIRNQYHPVRDYVHGLTWDGTARLDDWLIRCCIADADKLSRRRRQYLERVGKWFLMGMVARAMWPGCKFDYMLILEGKQGRLKSTLLNVLAGAWFADTGFVVGEKDTLQMLQGRWLYEIGELDAMARAEVTKIKAFVASKEDWYRASYDKRPRSYKRQIVFAGTTNEHQYLVDPTGNRRFWPVAVTRLIDIEWLQGARDQLFAEAWHRLQQKERYHPIQSEEVELFIPEQNARLIESPIEAKLFHFLTADTLGLSTKQGQVVSLLEKIGIDLSKLGPGRHHEKQAGAALRKFGWERKRSSGPGRPWVYVRPLNWPDCMDLDALDGTSEDVDEEPKPTRPPQANNQEDDRVPF